MTTPHFSKTPRAHSFKLSSAVMLTGAALLLSGCAALGGSDLFSGSGSGTTSASNAAGTTAVATDVGVSARSFETLSVTDGRNTGTTVGARVETLRSELRTLQDTMVTQTGRVNTRRAQATANSRDYHTTRGAITSRLQRGTTPGNPELVAQWNQAQAQLDAISSDINAMSGLSTEIATNASTANYLLEATQATFSLSGAIEEDHRQLRILQDETRQTTVLIERLLTELRDDIARQTTYVANERASLTTLANAIKAGELFGSGLTVSNIAPAAATAGAMSAPAAAGTPALVTISFDRPDVQYQQALYTALSRALEVRPAAQFDVVAISPSAGSPDRVQIAQSQSRRNAETVVRTMNEMGLPADRIRLSATTRGDIAANEVRIYVR
ncbi:hypothetical protein [Pyruvatibacter sp.]|uniref:hypothetical protein n=1 Tax=Pyruvatibacter sp. TaxID=1981328 RepID=UPI0032ED40E9